MPELNDLVPQLSLRFHTGAHQPLNKPSCLFFRHGELVVPETSLNRQSRKACLDELPLFTGTGRVSQQTQSVGEVNLQPEDAGIVIDRFLGNLNAMLPVIVEHVYPCAEGG